MINYESVTSGLEVALVVASVAFLKSSNSGINFTLESGNIGVDLSGKFSFVVDHGVVILGILTLISIKSVEDTLDDVTLLGDDSLESFSVLRDDASGTFVKLKVVLVKSAGTAGKTASELSNDLTVESFDSGNSGGDSSVEVSDSLDLESSKFVLVVCNLGSVF